jgi:hypothetical protein
MPNPLKPEEVARFAAEGVAIALKARDASYRGTIHIICGFPRNGDLGAIYRVSLETDEQGTLRAGAPERHQME